MALSYDELVKQQTGNQNPTYDAQGMYIPPNPVVTPGTGGSLQGTMTTPQAPSAPAAPAAAPAPTNAPQSNPFGLSQVMTAIQGKVSSNNALMSQRNLLLKQLYDQPLTDQEKAQLDPTLKSAVDSGDRNQIDMSLRLISDEVAGRKQTLDQSINYLVNGYQQQQQSLQQQRQDAINTVLQFGQVYGDKAKDALTSLYGPDYLSQLKSQGIDIEKFVATPTLAQTAARSSGGGGGITYPDSISSVIVDAPTDAAVKAIIASRPGDGGYGDAYTAVKNKFGEAIAQSYDAQYKAIFNNGQSVDQAFSGGGSGNTVPSDLASLASKYNKGTNYTNDAIVQMAMTYAATGSMPALGNGSSAQVRAIRAAVSNTAAELLKKSGKSQAQFKSEYNSAQNAIKNRTDQISKLETSAANLQAQFDRLAQLADKLNLGSSRSINAAKIRAQAAIGNKDAASYEELLRTIQSDYANMQAAVSGSRGSEYLAQSATQAIPSGMTGEQYRAVLGTLQQSSVNAQNAMQGQVDSMYTNVFSGLGLGGGTSSNSSGLDNLRNKYNY